MKNSNSFNIYQRYLYRFLSIFDIIYSRVIEAILYIIVSFFVLIMVYIESFSYKSFKFIGISFLIPSVVLGLMNLILLNMNFSYNFINSILSEFTKYCVTYFITFLFLVTLNIIIYFRRKEAGENGKIKEKIKKKN